MARIETVQLVDDLTGAPAVETIKFGLDGEKFSIDASEATARRLRSIIGKYAPFARRVRPTGKSALRDRTASATGSDRMYRDEVRGWARKHGVTFVSPATGERKTVGEKGRIPASVYEAYERRDRATGEPHRTDAPPTDRTPPTGKANTATVPRNNGKRPTATRSASNTISAPVFSSAEAPQSTGSPTTTGGKATGGKAGKPGTRPDGAAREWAQLRGFIVSPRGRVDGTTIKAYLERDPKTGNPPVWFKR